MIIFNFYEQKHTEMIQPHQEIADQALMELLEFGYTIIPDILTYDEVETATNLFHDWKQTIPNHDDFHRNVDPHGIYKYHEVGQQPHAWFIRTRPAVQEIYKYIWSCDNLITSFDGCCYIPAEDNRIDKCWTHTDQSGKIKDFQCYQGFVSLTNNKERTLVVYEGSHDFHSEYFKNYDTSTIQWTLIDPKILETKLKDKKRILEVPAGALVMWDSRTFHQNQFGKLNNGEERLVQYVCFYPRNHPDNTLAMRKKRHKYFEERRTTSHWPCPIRVNSKQPHTYGNNERLVDYTQLRIPDLTEFREDIKKLL